MASRDTGAERETRSLMSRPQPLGFLPTLWFWDELQHWRHIAGPFALFLVLQLALFGALGLGFWWTFALSTLALAAFVGAIERAVRRGVTARRRQLAPIPVRSISPSARSSRRA